MFTPQQYELLDFGNGRRLERFGALVLDRPCPSASLDRPAVPELWKTADARFDEFTSKKRRNDFGVRGAWKPITSQGEKYFLKEGPLDLEEGRQSENTSSLPWLLPVGDKFVLELKGSPFGHVGVFPEQAENWERIYRLCHEGAKRLGTPIYALNLFGYTGAASLAAAAAGADVTHLDAARNIVTQARRNAEATETPDADLAARARKLGPTRWIVDDAPKYVKREIRRESQYHGIILDPPSYGHGARGEVWRIARDLEPLLENCIKLLNDSFNFVLLTGHTPGFESAKLGQLLRQAYLKRFGSTENVRFETKPLVITSRSGASLSAGDMALAVMKG